MPDVEMSKVTIVAESNTADAQKDVKDLKDNINNLNSATSSLQTATSGLSGSMNTLGSDVKQALSSIKKTQSETSSAAKSTNRLTQSVRQSGVMASIASGAFFRLGSQIKRMMVRMVIKGALNGLINGLKSGYRELIKWSYAVNNADSAMASGTADAYASSFYQLRNSVGAAVAPLLQALLPVVQTLTGWFIQAANAVNQFISALTGKKTYTKAVPVNVQYSKSLAGVSDSAKKATGSVKDTSDAVDDLKNNMNELGFDELNVISPDDKPSGGSGGGTGGGGGGASGGGVETPDWANAFTTDKIDSQIANFAQTLKDLLPLIGKVGGALLAAFAASKLFKALSKLTGLSDGVATALNNIATAIAGFAIGFAVGFFSTLAATLWDAADGSIEFADKLTAIEVVAGGVLTVIGAITGSVGLMAGGLGLAVGALFGYATGINQAAAEAFKATEVGQQTMDMIAEADEIIKQSQEDIQNLNDSLVNLNSGANDYRYLQGLADSVYELNSKAEKTPEDMQKIQSMVDILNQNGINIEVDSSGVLTAKEEVDKLIDSQQRQIQLEAAKESLTAAYKAQYDAAYNMVKANQNIEESQKNNNDAIEIYNAKAKESNGILSGLMTTASVLTGGYTNMRDAMDAMGLSASVGTNALMSYDLESAQTIQALAGTEASLLKNKKALDDSTTAYENSSTQISDLTDMYTKLQDENISLSEIYGSSSDIISQANNLMSDSTKKTSDAMSGSYKDMGKNLKDTGTDLKDKASNLGDDVVDGYTGKIKSSMGRFYDINKELSERGFAGSKDGFDSHSPSRKMGNLASDVIQGYVNTIRLKQQSMYSCMKNLATKSINAFATEMKSANSVKSINSFMTSLESTINNNSYRPVNAFRSMCNSMIDIMNNFLVNCQRGLQSLMNSFANTMNSATVSGGKAQYSMSPVNRIPKLASGGVIRGSGQVFSARENGVPELVGSYGNQTAVMNNDQIVSAVATGVYNAVLSAMSNSNGNNQNITIELDGEVIYRNQEKIKRNKGYNLGLGAFNFG